MTKLMIIADHSEKNKQIIKYFLKPGDKLTKIGGQIMRITENDILNEKNEFVTKSFVIWCQGNMLQYLYARIMFSNFCIMPGWPVN
jgi:hypothetical protein